MFNTGASVLSCCPFVHVLYGTRRDSHCEECFQQSQDLKRCSSCHLIRYCGVSCQKKAWKLHKFECKFLKACRPNVPDSTSRIFLKLLAANHLGRSDEKDKTGLRCLNDLQSNVDKIKGDPLQMMRLMSLLSLIRNYASEFLDYPDGELLLEMAGKLQTNSYEITDSLLQGIGVGLYLSGSIFDHSCDPNCVFVFEGPVLTVRALKPIAAFEEVRVAYCDVMQSRSQRQQILSSTYYFSCKCARCMEEESENLVPCAAEDCNGGVSVAMGQCSLCGLDQVVNKSKVRDFVEDVVETLAVVNDLMDKNEYPKAIEKCLETYSTARHVLHSNDIYMSQLKDRLFLCYDNQEKLSDAFDLAANHRLLECMERYYSENHPKLAVFRLTLGTLLMRRGDSREALENFLRAKDIFQITRCEGAEVLSEVNRMITECREICR